jgi:hypothetical protein
LKLGNNVHLRNVLYVPGLENNLVSIYFLEDKGNIIDFVDGKVLSWHKDSSIENVRVIGSHEGNLYRLLEQNEEALVHDEVNPMLALDQVLRNTWSYLTIFGTSTACQRWSATRSGNHGS